MRHLHVAVSALAIAFLAACQTVPAPTAPRMAAAPPAIASSDRERDLYLSVIGQLIDHGKYYAALAHLDEFQRQHGATEPSRRLRGDAWLAIGAFESAEAEYQAIATGELVGYGEHGLGRVASARRDWPSAARHFERAVQVQPTNTGFLQDFASALFELGRMDDAEFQLRKALELSASGDITSDALRAMLADRSKTDFVRTSAVGEMPP